MRTTGITALAIFSFWINAKGQQLSPTVLASGGSHFNSGTSQISWTLGEPVIETINGGGGQSSSLTQGFHQPLLNFSKINESGLNNQINIFPNPAQMYFTIEFKEAEPQYEIEITDILGRSVYKSRKEENKFSIKIPTDQYAEGNYFLRIYNEDNSFYYVRDFIISN